MIPAIVLAAGASSRMGAPKAVLPIGQGDTFLTRIARTLRSAGCQEIFVVLGNDGELVRRHLSTAAPDITPIDNPSPERGQLSSLLVGLAAAERQDVPAVLVTLVDVPLVTTATITAILNAYRQRGDALIVRPAMAGRYGHPTIFDRRPFAELRNADPSAGAKAVIRARPAGVVDVPVEDEGAFIDIDTPAGYAQHIGGE